VLFLLHYHIINISFDVSPNLGLQDDVNIVLISCSPVLQPKCHFGITEDPKRHDERYFLFIVTGEADLMIS
jgi:hypothetical protein